MADSTIYNSEIDWKAVADNVVQLTKRSVENPATYRLTVKPIDTNDKGAGIKAVNDLFVDNWGTIYPIIAVNGDEIDVVDTFRTRKCPKMGKVGRVCRTVADGNGNLLAPIKYDGLNPSAASNAKRKEIDILFKKLYGEKYLLDPEKWIKCAITESVEFAQYLGQDHLLEGNRSTAIGQGHNTKSFLETIIGAYAKIADGQNSTEWIPTDLLLTVGNGTDADNRSNAVEVYKSGLIKLYNALLIGEYDNGSVPPVNGMLQYTEANGLQIYNDGWTAIGGGGGSFPATVTSSTTNEDNGTTHTHELGYIDDDKILTGNPVEYGALYNYYAATNIRNITSVGWHIPSMDEFQTLADYLGASGQYTTNNVGNLLKEEGLAHWANNLGTNSVKFNLMGAGSREDGGFQSLKGNTVLITTSKFNGNSTVYFAGAIVYSSNSNFICNIYTGYKNYSGQSLRPIKDSTTLTHGQTGTYVGNDGKVYPTICIGTQEWLACNLNETKYRNGDWIHGFDGGVYTPISNSAWSALTSEAMCYYNDNTAYGGGQTPLSSLIVTDHGALTGLGDDDHAQYFNQTRGDARYLQKANNLSDLTNASTARTNLGLGSIAVKNFWTGTLTAYNAIATKDANTIYHIEE